MLKRMSLRLIENVKDLSQTLILFGSLEDIYHELGTENQRCWNNVSETPSKLISFRDFDKGSSSTVLQYDHNSAKRIAVVSIKIWKTSQRSRKFLIFEGAGWDMPELANVLESVLRIPQKARTRSWKGQDHGFYLISKTKPFSMKLWKLFSLKIGVFKGISLACT